MNFRKSFFILLVSSVSLFARAKKKSCAPCPPTCEIEQKAACAVKEEYACKVLSEKEKMRKCMDEKICSKKEQIYREQKCLEEEEIRKIREIERAYNAKACDELTKYEKALEMEYCREVYEAEQKACHNRMKRIEEEINCDSRRQIRCPEAC